jgi:hypothetical protein
MTALRCISLRLSRKCILIRIDVQKYKKKMTYASREGLEAILFFQKKLHIPKKSSTFAVDLCYLLSL